MRTPETSHISRSPSPELSESAPQKKQRTSIGDRQKSNVTEPAKAAQKPEINIFALTNTSTPAAMNKPLAMETQSMLDRVGIARTAGLSDKLSAHAKPDVPSVSGPVRFEALGNDIQSITPDQRKALAHDLVKNGLALIPLSAASRAELLHAGLEMPNGRDAVSNPAHSIKDPDVTKHLTSLANDIFSGAREAYRFPSTQLEPYTLDIKTWNFNNAAFSLHQDKALYPIIMGATVSEGERGAPMEYLSRDNMVHYDLQRKEPKDSFDANKHISKVPEGHLAIFTSRNGQNSDTPGLVHKSPDNSNDRTIALFRFQPVGK